MNHKELVKSIAQEVGKTQKEIEEFLGVYSKKVHEALVADGEVVLKDIAKITTKVREKREGRNPKTGETVQIDEKVVPVVKAVTSLKDTVANGEVSLTDKTDNTETK